MKQKLRTRRKQYKARRTTVFSDEEAQLVGEELETIKSRDGNLTTVGVLDEASDSRSKLHKFFEWNDTEASRQFREQQARLLIGNVVEVVVVDNKPIKQRSFLSVSAGEGKGQNAHIYVTIEEAIGNPDYKKELLTRIISMQENLINTMKLLREKY